MDHSIPFRPKNALEDPYTLYNECLDALAAEILEAKYEKVDSEEVAELQKHLLPHRRKELGALLKCFNKLFDGTLGCYPHCKMHIELIDGARPVHMRPYAVPYHNRELFQKELLHLVDLGVLERISASE